MKIHLETPEEIRHQIWKELGRATQDRHHEWRTPVLATVGQDGWPRARTVVLRRADALAGQLDIYTDSRSPKVAQMRAQPLAQFVFWSARLSWQLRVRVQVDVMCGQQVEELWHVVRQSASAGDYLTVAAPGEPLAADPGLGEVATPAVSFAVLRAHVVDMDWLELSRNGHRRAQLGPQAWRWLTP